MVHYTGTCAFSCDVGGAASFIISTESPSRLRSAVPQNRDQRTKLLVAWCCRAAISLSNETRRLPVLGQKMCSLSAARRNRNRDIMTDRGTVATGAATWLSVSEAAAILGVKEITLRRTLERNSRRRPDGSTTASVDGVQARKFQRQWRVSLDRTWLEPGTASRTG